VLKCGKLSNCRNKEVTLSVGRCGVVTVVCLSMSSGGWVAICSCGHSQNFEGIVCFRILSRSVQCSLCRLIFLIAHMTREVQLSCVVSQGLCFMAVRMSKCRVKSALKFPLPQTVANSLVSWAPVCFYKPLCFRCVTTHTKIMTTLLTTECFVGNMWVSVVVWNTVFAITSTLRCLHVLNWL
jgi:hypothetical protein